MISADGHRATMSSMSSASPVPTDRLPPTDMTDPYDISDRTGGAAVEGVWSNWGNVIAWCLVGLFILVIVGLIIWWVVAITVPRRARDKEVRDLHARDITASCNVCLGGSLTVGGVTNEAAAIIKALSLPPVSNSSLSIALDGTQTSIMLTAPQDSPVSVTLPPAADNAGLIVAIFNESGSSSFSVAPAGSDTIEGAAGPVTEMSSVVLVSMGVTPNGSANWKHLF